LGTQLAGAIGQLRPVEEVRDPIYAKALVLESAGRKFCILVLDLTLITKAWADAIRREAAERIGIEKDAVMVCATQTHSAPALGHAFAENECEYVPDNLRWLLGGDDAFHEMAVERSLLAIEQANTSLEPVEVAAASGIEGRVAFNRRFVMRDGTAVTQPPYGDARIRHAEGPMDPEVGVVSFRNRDGQVIGVLLHYTSHPNHGYPHLYVSADWPGAWSEGVRELFGEQCVPLVLNGCCGNIHHQNHLDPHHVNDLERMSRLLTETTASILPRLEYKEVDVLDWKSTHIGIPWRDFEPHVFQNARKLLREHPKPIWVSAADKKIPLLEGGGDLKGKLLAESESDQVAWDWLYAIGLQDVEKQMQQASAFDYEIQVLRIGEIAVAALPGEPFVEAQLQIKMDSPMYPTYVAHMANQYVGYIPTAGALKRGGYETRPGCSSKLALEASDMIVNSTGELLRKIFQESVDNIEQEGRYA
jgi:hypothetical protein